MESINCKGKMETIEEECEMSTKQEAFEIFELCDQNNKGYVTAEDLKEMTIDLELTSEQIEMIFKQLDTDGDGLLTPEEFENGLELFRAKSTGLPTNNEDFYVTSRQSSTSEETNTSFEYTFTAASDCLKVTSQQDFSILLQSNVAIELWSQIQAQHPELIPIFEDFIQNLALKHQQIREETSILQDCFLKKSEAYEQQIRILYEEMENQIQTEKDMILNKENELEKRLKQELEKAIETKDNDIQDLLKKWLQATKQLETVSEIRSENKKLSHEKEVLELQIENYEQQLSELQHDLDEAKANNINEKRHRFRSVLQLLERIAWEREALVKHSNFLRSSIRQMLADKTDFEDTISVAHAKSVKDIYFLTNEDFCNSPAYTTREQRGSIMSDYFGIDSGHVTLNEQSQTDTEIPEENNSLQKNHEDAPENNQEDAPQNTKNTNPFLTDEGNYISIDENSDYSPINPFIGYSDKGDKTSTYTSFVEPDLDAYAIAPEGDVQRRTFEHHDPKHPVLCFVHPNNHQTNGLRHNNSLSDDVFPSPDVNNADDLITFDEVRHEQAATPNTVPPSNLVEKTSNSASSTETLQGLQSVFKVVFIGDSGVGKTSLINRICGGLFSDNFCSTIGVDFRIKTTVIGNHKVVLQLWDTAGQERFRSITSQYLRKSDGVLITYDVNSELSFCNVRSWMSTIEDVNNNNVVIALLGNKLDLSLVHGKKVVSTEEGKRLASDKDCLFFETSAKDGTGIESLISSLAGKLHSKQLEEMENCVNLTNNESGPLNHGKKCC